MVVSARPDAGGDDGDASPGAPAPPGVPAASPGVPIRPVPPQAARPRAAVGPDQAAVLPGPPPAAARALRTVVFVEEQGVPAQLEHDAADALADHAVVWDASGQALATARLLDPSAVPGLDLGPVGDDEAGGPAGDVADASAGIIGRVAVRPEARGRGLARAVTIALERRAAQRGLTAIRLHAQAAVAGLYEGLGYVAFGPRDHTAGIEHVWMRRPLVPGLRPVRDDDAPEIQWLIGACWAEYPGCVLDVDGEEPWMRAPATAYDGDRDPARYRGRMWVVEGEGELTACIAVRETQPGWAELKSLYVAASARRRGLGGALTRLVEREARRRGAGTVELWSDTRFTDAHRLYERLGYRRTGETRELGDLSNTAEFRYLRELSGDAVGSCP